VERLIEELPIERIHANPLNCRVKYDSRGIEKLAESLRTSGQLSAVRVRRDPSQPDSYELIFGHRRFLAAQLLGWTKLKAEIVEATDDEIVVIALLENLQREDLTDFEKGMVFERMNKEFHKSYEEIGRLVGLSRQTVSNHIAILRLFDADTLAKNPELMEALHAVSEHHTRLLAQVKDLESRKMLLLKVYKERLSVREVSHILGRLRSWFSEKGQVSQNFVDTKDVPPTTTTKAQLQSNADIEQVAKVVRSEFTLAKEKDFLGFKDIHLYGEGFSMYRAFPPLHRLDENHALKKEIDWFYRIAPAFNWELTNLRVDLLGAGDSAVATLTVCFHEGPDGGKKLLLRGTVVLVRKEDGWKIFHEHWSRLDEDLKLPPMVQERIGTLE
jgi:ParB/RepB/Spo0J family partition protein